MHRVTAAVDLQGSVEVLLGRTDASLYYDLNSAELMCYK